MMEMKEQTGSRKKYLAPVVVLMLCLVTLTGAAYAYSSTMTIEGNEANTKYISIDLTGGAATASTIEDQGNAVFTFEDNFKYNAAGKYNTCVCNITDNYIHYDITVTGDLDTDKVRVTSTGITALLATTFGSTAVSSLIDVKVGTTAGTGTAIVDATPVVLDVNKVGTDSAHVDIYVSFVHKVNDPVNVVDNVKQGESGYGYASQFVTALATKTFTLEFEAYKA